MHFRPFLQAGSPGAGALIPGWGWPGRARHTAALLEGTFYPLFINWFMVSFASPAKQKFGCTFSSCRGIGFWKTERAKVVFSAGPEVANKARLLDFAQ